MTDMRRGARHDVDYQTMGEHRTLGDIPLHIANISDHGFMAMGETDLDRGERITLSLPVIGRIEAHLVWTHGGRAGFQLERIIRPDQFRALLELLRSKPKG